MKKLMIALLASVLSFGAVAEASKRESVEQLLEVTNTDAIVDMMYAQMDQMFTGITQQLGVKPSEQEAVNAYMQKLVVLMQEEMSWEKMKEPMIDIYLKHYTEKEIQDMLAFYRTETGQSMIAKMPQVMQDSTLLSQQMMQGMIPKIKALAMELKQELQAKRSAANAQ